MTKPVTTNQKRRILLAQIAEYEERVRKFAIDPALPRAKNEARKRALRTTLALYLEQLSALENPEARESDTLSIFLRNNPASCPAVDPSIVERPYHWMADNLFQSFHDPLHDPFRDPFRAAWKDALRASFQAAKERGATLAEAIQAPPLQAWSDALLQHLPDLFEKRPENVLPTILHFESPEQWASHALQPSHTPYSHPPSHPPSPTHRTPYTRRIGGHKGILLPDYNPRTGQLTLYGVVAPKGALQYLAYKTPLQITQLEDDILLKTMLPLLPGDIEIIALPSFDQYPLGHFSPIGAKSARRTAALAEINRRVSELAGILSDADIPLEQASIEHRLITKRFGQPEPNWDYQLPLFSVPTEASLEYLEPWLTYNHDRTVLSRSLLKRRGPLYTTSAGAPTDLMPLSIPKPIPESMRLL